MFTPSFWPKAQIRNFFLRSRMRRNDRKNDCCQLNVVDKEEKESKLTIQFVGLSDRKTT